MASQYDDIGPKYNVFKTLPTALIEQVNFRDAVSPFLGRSDGRRGGVHVLDLACGTGFYSRKLLDWGAASVLGVDLSAGMIAEARRGWPEQDERLRFRVGDVQQLGAIDKENNSAAAPPFDLVTGVWLLNYAANLEEMAAMFASIAANLDDGGVFVGVTPPPVDDVDAFAKIVGGFEREHPRHWGVTVDYYERLPSGAGWKTEVAGHATGSSLESDKDKNKNRSGGKTEETEDAVVSFRNYHLRRDVYEEAARRGGMQGALAWRPVQLPDEAIAATGAAFWEPYFSSGPHLGLLVVKK